MIRKILAAALLLLNLSTCAFAQDFPEKPVGFVNDFAGLMTESQRQELEDYLHQQAVSTTNEISIATFKDLQGYPIEDFTYEVASAWGIGGAENSNGALLAVFYEDREVRIEVGYGLEPVLTDARCQIIIDEFIIPEFKNGDYYAGIKKGAEMMADVASGEYSTEQLDKYYVSDDGGSGRNAWVPIVIIAIIFLLIIFARRGGGGGWGGYGGGGYSGGGGFGGSWGGGGGGGGSSFGGFSGGSFGGGGASGSW